MGGNKAVKVQNVKSFTILLDFNWFAYGVALARRSSTGQ